MATAILLTLYASTRSSAFSATAGRRAGRVGDRQVQVPGATRPAALLAVDPADPLPGQPRRRPARRRYRAVRSEPLRRRGAAARAEQHARRGDGAEAERRPAIQSRCHRNLQIWDVSSGDI